MALLGLYHESNTFVPGLTGDEEFERGGTYRGGEIAEAFASAPSAAGGFLELASEPGIELVPLVFALANPSGTIAGPTLARLLRELLEPLRSEGPWDAVLLALHGAAVAETEADVGGRIVECVRAAVGGFREFDTGPRKQVVVAKGLHSLHPFELDTACAGAAA